MEQYLVYSKCLRKGFTSEEWGEYVRKHDTGKESVSEYAGFRYNIHDVCLNPNTVTYDDGSLRCEIRTAKSMAGWSFGYEYSTSTASGSGPARYKLMRDKGWYKTEREAAIAAVRIVLSFGDLKLKPASRQGLEKLVYSISQTELRFD